MTDSFIKEIRKIDYPNYRIHIIDDGSNDGSDERLRAKHPDIGITRTFKYIEYCKALNIGIRFALICNAEYVFLVNNDTRNFSKNYLTEMTNAFNDGTAIVGSKCYDYNKKILWTGKPKPKLGYSTNFPTCGFMVKTSVFDKIGLLDEGLERYMEDLDFSIRLKRQGYKTKGINNVSFDHKEHGTCGKQIWTPNYYSMRNSTWFMKRYCKDKSILWKLKRTLHDLYSRIIMSFNTPEYFIDINYAIFCGFIKGLIGEWKPEIGK